MSGRNAAFLFFFLSLFLMPLGVRGDWQPSNPLTLPRYAYSFMAATPDGDLLATTFNSEPLKGAVKQLPALLIRNPTSDSPQVTELCRLPFHPQYGYSGIASDPFGGFFVSIDTGNADGSSVRRFHADGSPDTTFAQNGVLQLGHRCLGLDIIGGYLLVAVDWGQVMVCDTKTGRIINHLKSNSAAPVYVRDVAVDPKSLRIFGVAQGGLVTWGGGVPWKQDSYSYRQITPPVLKPRSGEGVTVDPVRRTVLIAHSPGNIVQEVHGSGQVLSYPVTTAEANAQLSDMILSFDGSTLFVSDLIGMKVHVLKRDIARTIAQATLPTMTPRPNAQPFKPTAAPTNAPTWHRSYTDALETARNNGKPMLIYFRGDVPRCREIESQLILSQDFNARVSDTVCVFENVDNDRLLAYRFGVFRIPHVVLLDPSGETRAEFRYDIKRNELFNAMEAISSPVAGR